MKQPVRKSGLAIVLLLIFLCSACRNEEPAVLIVEEQPEPTATVTKMPSTATAVPSDTPIPPTATTLPTETPLPDTPTPTVEPSPTALPPLSGSGGGVIAYVSELDLVPGITIMNADGSDQRRLTDTFDAHPSWSPDGTKIVFSARPEGIVAISMVDVGTVEISQLTDTERAPSAPDWSPDGELMAIIYNPAHPGINFELYTMNAFGGEFNRLTTSQGYQYYDNPDWSPDGSKLLYTADLEGDNNIYIADADGQNQVQLTFGAENDRNATWSPDGTTIAFESNREGNWEIYLMNADGSNVRNISNHESRDQWPAWSPDGSRIAFQSSRDGNWEIYIMNADGSDQVRVTENEVADTNPAWRP